MKDEFFPQETGASEGDARGNLPDAPGSTEGADRLFRSHFQHAYRMADRVYDDIRPAYFGEDRVPLDTARDAKRFEDLEKDVEGGWINLRTHAGDWTSVRDLAMEGFERGRRLGFVDDAIPPGGIEHEQLPPYADPVADGIDPTSPESPEQNFGSPPPPRAD